MYFIYKNKIHNLLKKKLLYYGDKKEDRKRY